MPRKEQAPRWETKDYGERRIFHGYTDYGMKMIDHGFFIRITRPELFKGGKFPDELHKLHGGIYDPYTKDIEADIKRSCLSDETVENILYNLSCDETNKKYNDVASNRESLWQDRFCHSHK